MSLLITDAIHWHVCFALAELKKQIESNQFKRLIISSNRELFDIDTFTNWLETTTIENHARLKDILIKSENISNLHNNEFKDLELQIDPNTVYSFSLPSGGFLQVNSEIECITISDKNYYYTIKTKNAFQDFFELNSRFKIYSSQEFAYKAARLINIITSFFQSLKKETPTFNLNIKWGELKKSLIENNLELFFKILKSYFSAHPYYWSKNESYYHSNIHTILEILGFNVLSEQATNQGRIDTVVETDNFVFILEFKVGNKNSICQIIEKKYYEPYQTIGKKIVLVGVEFSSKERNIIDWHKKELD
ncbi:MAG TPA: PD-(D/E)XK nuclease domain-containing protein [Puia sp.]|nr:PD-(D/E)XK nuclease domain-containing protein [Puia sp.]